jgi:hypothetical protein
MLKLSIEEQKEILGGKWKATIYDPFDLVYEVAYFDTEDEAISWAENYMQNWGNWTVTEVH